MIAMGGRALTRILLLVVIVGALVSVGNASALRYGPGAAELQRRETGNTEEQRPATTSAQPTPTSSNKPWPEETSRERDVTSTASKTAAKSTQVTASASGRVPAASGDVDIAPTDPSQKVYKGGLPIPPKVTPGVGVAGVFLMLLGWAYGLIGIKIKRLHIFLSSAFLASLGVTVLIIYVMNPPVSDAIQGAYVVAAVVTGIVSGGLAIVFPEVTECLGLLLGGFCVAMWFLVLTPGGLITAVYGKIVMIAVWSLGVFALAFHPLTKPYALIFSLSFGGATATVLGIDCFSRAGMKEFWIYIWDLNDRLFPLETNTYPHTRGLRVEIAGIILLTALGIMSQVKLWKIIKQRHDAKDKLKRQQDAMLEAADEESGRRIEERIADERRQWEAAYGNPKPEEDRPRSATSEKSKTDSGAYVNSGRSSGDIVTEEVTPQRGPDTLGMSQVSTGKRIMSMTSLHEEVILEEDEEEGVERGPSPGNNNPRTSLSSLGDNSDAAPSPVLRQDSFAGPNRPRGPAITPLPIPVYQGEVDANDDSSSVATRAESDFRILEDAIAEGTENAFVGRMPIVDPPLEFDRASSVAATCDDRGELDEDEEEAKAATKSNRVSYSSQLEKLSVADATLEAEDFGKRLSRELIAKMGAAQDLSEPAKEGQIRVVVTDTGKQEISSSEDSSTAENSRLSPAEMPSSPSSPGSSDKQSTLPQDLAPSSYPKPESAANGHEISNRCSKLMKTYRTNEWAKHISEAEPPAADELPEIDDGDDAEKPVQVDIVALQESVTAVPGGIAKHPSVKPVNKKRGSRGSLYASRESLNRLSTPDLQQTGVSPSPTPPAAAVAPKLTPRRSVLGPSPSYVDLPSNTLMAKRESIVRSKSSLAHFDTMPTAVPNIARPGSVASRAPSVTGTPVHHAPLINSISPRSSTVSLSQGPVLTDDMPLTDRQQLLLQQPLASATRLSASTPIQAAEAQAERMRRWRESMRDEEKRLQFAHADQKRGEMMWEKNAAAEKEVEKKRRMLMEEMLPPERMRKEDMKEIHKEALRKMQSQALRNIT